MTKAQEYKANFNIKFKHLYVAVCSLVMSLYSHDFLMMYCICFNNSSRLTIHSAWFLDGKTSICCIVYLTQAEHEIAVGYLTISNHFWAEA